MPSDELIKVCTSKMKKAFEIFCQELASLRTGRANASMLDIIKVDVYGQMMPINQLAEDFLPIYRQDHSHSLKLLGLGMVME